MQGQDGVSRSFGNTQIEAPNCIIYDSEAHKYIRNIVVSCCLRTRKKRRCHSERVFSDLEYTICGKCTTLIATCLDFSSLGESRSGWRRWP